MEFKAYTLMDAAAMSRSHPLTFGAPRKSDIASLQVGDMVKVCANFDPHTKLGDIEPTVRHEWAKMIGQKAADKIGGERFWVEITSVERLPKGGRVFVGTVQNDLVYKAHHGLDFGQELNFEDCHLLDFTRAENSEARAKFDLENRLWLKVPTGRDS